MQHYTAQTLAAAETERQRLAQAPILFAGTPPLAADALRGLLAAGADIAAVLTRPDAPVGRKRRLSPSPVAEAANEAGIPVFKASSVDDDLISQLPQTRAQLGVVVAYGALLPQSALDALPRGWVNLHYSRLPKYRGAAPVQHALLNQETQTAATVFQLEAGMDTGPVHGTVDYAIPEGHSTGHVLEDLTRLGTQLLTVLLPDLLEGTSLPEPQRGDPTMAPKLHRQDAYIDPHQPAAELISRINATIPEPGAWTLLGENRIKLGPARAYAGQLPRDATAGTVLLCAADSGPDLSQSTDTGHNAGPSQVVVLTAGNYAGVVLTQVQPAGKQMMNAADWLRGQSAHVQFGGDQ